MVAGREYPHRVKSGSTGPQLYRGRLVGIGAGCRVIEHKKTASMGGLVAKI
jgi:hypothetical protein